ncbi:MAG: zinc ribbon domain-containing protein [Burkholderiaceae bacterium]
MKGLRLRERLYRWLLWLIALAFAAFLTGLGGRVIGDLPRLDRALELEQFVDPQAAAPLDDRIGTLQRELATLSDQLDTAGLALSAARNASRSARESFQNWIATRGATGLADQDPDLVARTRALDDLKAGERARQTEVEALEARALAARQSLTATQAQRSELQRDARQRLRNAQFRQELRVFGYRLALTLPLLIVAGWLFARHRNGTWWPFVWGFGLFALFAFFVELVPYLPSYGGYVRHTVGIVLTAVAGIALIRAMRRYQANRQAEQAQPQDERRHQIRYEQALGLMHKGVCPGCERSFRIGTPAQPEPEFCMHCGLRLFSRCPACSARHNVFFRFCPACGVTAAAPAPGQAPVPDN